MVREVSLFCFFFFFLVGKVFKLETLFVVVLAFSLRLCDTCCLYNKYSFWTAVKLHGLPWELGEGESLYVALWFPLAWSVT